MNTVGDWRHSIREHLATLHLDPTREAAVTEEIAQHLEERFAALQRSGMGEAEARERALAELPNAHELMTALASDATGSWRDPEPSRTDGWATLIREVRHGARSLRRQPRFTVLVTLTLAIGIGATTSIFSLLYAVLLRPLPFPDPDRLVVVGWNSPAPGIRGGFFAYWSNPWLRGLERSTTSFTGLAGYAQRSVTLTSADPAERLTVELVSGSYFGVLGLPILHGRGIHADDDRSPTGTPVVVLGHRLWAQRFGADSTVVGQSVTFNKTSFTVIGVAAPSVRGQSGQAAAWVPATTAAMLFNPRMVDSPIISWLEVVGRLRAGVSIDQAAAELDAARSRIFAGANEVQMRQRESARLMPLAEYKRDPAISRSFVILFGAVAFTLLIACVNVATLLLARESGRRREVAMRLAIGASRWSIARQRLIESLMLAGLGGLSAAVIAIWGIAFLAKSSRAIAGRQVGVSASQLFDFYQISLNGPVLAFNFAIAAVTAILCGVVPAWLGSRADVNDLLFRGSSGRATLRLGRGGATAPLVCLEMALATVLLAGAGLMTRSLAGLRSIDLGYDPNGVIVASISSGQRPDAPRLIIERLAAEPGIQRVGAGSNPPLSGFVNKTPVKVRGAHRAAGGDLGVHYVGGDAFGALGARLLRGRPFSPLDRNDGALVAILNRTAARTLFGDANPLGRHISLDVNWAPDTWAEIVGVVDDIPYGALENGVEPDIYLPFEQDGFVSSVFLRTSLPPEAAAGVIRRAVGDVDRTIAVSNVRTLSQLGGEAVARTRYASLLLSAFAGFALLLAALGVFGVVANGVATAERDIGIRVALGATRARILRMVLQQSFVLVGIGTAAGLVIAYAATRLLRGVLYLVSPTDLVTYVSVTALLIVVGVLAALLPARRAASLDPARIIRGD